MICTKEKLCHTIIIVAWHSLFSIFNYYSSGTSNFVPVVLTSFLAKASG